MGRWRKFPEATITETKAKDLKVGDEIRLLFMGGTEDVKIVKLRKNRLAKTVSFMTYDMVAGQIKHNLKYDDEVRVVTWQ